MSNQINLGEANRIIKLEGQIFENLSKIFTKLYSSEEKTKNIRKECFQNFESLNKISEKDNKILEKLFITFGKEMKSIEEEAHNEHLTKIKDIIIPVLQNYPNELKKNKEDLEAISKARKDTEDLKKSFGGPEDIRKSQKEEENKTKTFENTFIKYETQRLADNKQIIAKFIHSELKYHCQAIEKLSKLFAAISKANVNAGLKKFSQKYGIKKFDFGKLGLNMEEILEQEEENLKKKIENKDEVLNGEKSQNKNQESDDENNDGNTDSNDDNDNDKDKDKENANFSKSMSKSKLTNRGKNSMIMNKSKSKQNKMSKISESKNLEDEF